MPGTLRLALLATALSGAAALVYEITWLRMLGLVVGHAVNALTAVLAAFMAGLALGAAIFGRVAGRVRRPLVACAWVEVGIAGTGVLLPFAFGGILPVSLAVRQSFDLSYDAFGLVQVALAGPLLLVPTILMGGTLPLLSQGLSQRLTDVAASPARAAGGCYAANTAGAVLGALAAGYWLLPALGNRATGWMAACVNLGAAALLVATSSARPSAAEERPSPLLFARERARREASLVAVAIAVSGAATMVFEVAWTRALALVVGSSTYAFTAVLVAILIGLAAGSGAYVWLWGGRPASLATLATVQAAVGVSATSVLLSMDRLPDLLLLGLRWSRDPGWIVLLQLLLSVGALLLATLCIGAVFPCALAAATTSAAGIGRQLGRLYAVNTVGAVVGVVVGGLGLVPSWGAHGSLKAAIVASLVMAALLWLAARQGRRAWVPAAAALVIAGVVALLPPWDARIMSAGPSIYANLFLRDSSGRGFRDLARADAVLFYRDGKSGSVAVTRSGSLTLLRVNGKIDAGTGSDMPTQILSAHLPLLAHPAPRDVFILGLGSGVTAAAALAHPIERLDVVELEPAVIEASRFFAEAQGRRLGDPRLRLRVGDGRSLLLGTTSRYDVIISEPSNPWVRGMAGLFSVEFFTLVRDRLRPGGVVLQWLQAYNLSTDDMRMIVATFRSVFPDTSLWQSTAGDLLLLGRTEASPLALAKIRARWEALPAVRDDFSKIPMGSWAGLFGFFVLGQFDIARLVAGAGLNTDDRLPLEWTAPRALYMDTTPANLALLNATRRDVLPALAPGSERELDRAGARYWMGMACLRRLAAADALANFEQAMALEPTQVAPAVGASTAALVLGRHADALVFAQRALARDPAEPKALFFAGVASWWLGRTSDAARYLERAVELDPQNEEFRSVLLRLRSGTLSR